VQNPRTELESISNNLDLRPARGFVSLSPRGAFFLMLIILIVTVLAAFQFELSPDWAFVSALAGVALIGLWMV
jgi:uncharacterized membrane protein